jgi:hypothetical protein
MTGHTISEELEERTLRAGNDLAVILLYGLLALKVDFM